VDIREVYIDTIGNPETYQRKLERLFPSLKITVAKKADSLFPCVSAASVLAKVTRDIGLEVCYEGLMRNRLERVDVDESSSSVRNDGWGSGYPSDSKCVSWLRQDMHVVFGWGNECRFSWGTAKEMLEGNSATTVDWPVDGDETARLDGFLTSATDKVASGTELSGWYGQKSRSDFLA
jgi:ribonuclease H2 subunit A